MGVLSKQDRKRSNLLYTNFLSDDDIDTLQVDDDARSDHDTLTPTHQTTSRATSKKSRAPHPQCYIKNTGRRARGCTNSRKYENSVFLSDLIEPCEFDDLDITDFMVKSVSAFDMLFEDESQMKRWSDFVSMKGEEQDRYLQELACVSIDKCSSDFQNTCTSGNKFCDSDLKNATKCFQKVDSRIKKTLKSRNISMDGLKFFEEELLSFFIHIDEAVLVSLVPSSMDRLLVHGICQYMNLTSSSSPRHVIQVENNRNQFQPPVILLSQYLQRVR